MKTDTLISLAAAVIALVALGMNWAAVSGETKASLAQHLEGHVTLTALQEQESESLERIRAAAESVSKAIPVGTILSFYGSTNQIPTGFLLCDGNQYPSTDYTVLSKHLLSANPKLKVNDQIFKIPDLRGMFLRGLDSGRGKDSETHRTLGSEQSDSIIKHQHPNTVEENPHTHKFTAMVNRPTKPRDDEGIDTTSNRANQPAVSFSDGHRTGHQEPAKTIKVSILENESGTLETRPENVAVNFIIKY